MPERIQRKRTKGWRMPPNTVCVTRPGIFGNPFDSALIFEEALKIVGNQEPFRTDFREHMQRIVDNLEQLRGKNLACFCPLDKPCHADVLLEYANR